VATDKNVSEAEAIKELRERAGGRADLLAEVAGVELGSRSGEPDESVGQRIAELCILAGADEEAMERWVQVGQTNKARARSAPQTYTKLRG
jgi:hypothetical protein